MKIKVLITTLTICLMGFLFTGCAAKEDGNSVSFTEPTNDISRQIVREVAKNGYIKFPIRNMSINNPEYLNSNSSSIHANISLMVVNGDDASLININIKNPVDSHDGTKQKDILVFMPDVSNIHYTDNNEDCVIIKDSPHGYYIEGSIKMHSYVAEIYLNKSNNVTKLGANAYDKGKFGVDIIDSQQVK